MSIINLDNINQYKGSSQKGQHCYIDNIFKIIGFTNKYYVDIGAYDGITNSNVIDLKNKFGFNGLMIDNNRSNPNINLHKYQVTKENICEIFKLYNVPKEFDILSLDIDGMDYWILKEILTEFSPRIIVVEANVRFEPSESKVLKYDPNYNWDGYNWYGASPLAFKKLVNKFNYTPIYILYDDMFIVRNDCLSQEQINKPWKEIYKSSNIDLYKDHIRPPYNHPAYQPISEQWMEI